MKLTRLFTDFFESERAGGFILLGCTVLSLLIANSDWGASYISFWQFELADHGLVHWINDGLMTIFFLMIGLELERELYGGELSNVKNAMLPVFGAIGGMLFPAALYLFFNYGRPEQGGAGIPMATDIAFAIGIMSLLGNRVPPGLKIFLTALAVIDDLGAILVIAFFYSKGVVLFNLGMALLIFSVLLVLNRLKVDALWIYLIGGVGMWYFMLHSGIHPTITGVLLAFALPYGDGGEKTVSYKLQHFLHKPVSLFILPLFAIANTAMIIPTGWTDNLYSKASLGIIVGLVLGKPIGIYLFSLMAVRFKISSLPADIKWKHLIGAGFLAGIGFTMSIFITLLAFSDERHITAAKMAILAASVISAIIGLTWLWLALKSREASKSGRE